MINIKKIFILSIFIIFISAEAKPKLVLSMIVYNEANKYITKVLESTRDYIDAAVILDDCSTDNTIQVIEDVLKGIPCRIVKHSKSIFCHESNARKEAWEEALKENPDWVLILDADQMFEVKFKDHIEPLLNQNDCDVLCFRLYDFWDEKHYRDDPAWSAHHYYKPFIVRAIKNFNWQWIERERHCPPFPANINKLRFGNSSLRVKHYGWAKLEDRIHKYNRYYTMDPEVKYGWREQYDSILDANPHLIEWIE
jgi:glycosyltransferase involved in cell wall biosynthesis